MRRTLLVLGFVATVLTAGAADADAPVAEQAWSRTGLVPTFVAEQDRLYVAADVGTESARTYVGVDLGGLPDGADSGVVLQLVEVADELALAGDPAIVACALATPIIAGGELSAETAPSADCSAAVTVDHADGTWAVPLDSFLPDWRRGPALGVALVPAPGSTTFRVAFDPAATSIVTPPAGVTVSGDPAPAGSADDSGATAAVTPTGPALADAGPGSALPGLDDPSLTTSPQAAAGASTPISGSDAAATLPESASRMLPAAPVDAASPPALVVLGLVGMTALAAAIRVGRHRPRPTNGGRPVPSAVIGLVGGSLALFLVPVLLAETTVYKLGLVMIVVVAATGLHLLVNWAGELSLAHAALIGLPAFVVARISADHGVSPITLLPVAVGVGLVSGAVVGLPAIRARGLQVALVTLAAGVAIDRFFFTKTWLVGSVSDDPIATPSLGPLAFTTSRGMYPVLATAVVASVAVAWMIHRSKLGRAFLWVRAQPDAAAAFGIPVARYRVTAYALAGGFAGLSGGLTTMWVQRLTPEAFPLSRSFTLLIIVALAGRGFIGGVALAALAIEGGPLFISSGDAFVAYAAPLGLILILTRHPAGLNGLGRRLAARFRTLTPNEGKPTMEQHKLHVRPLLATGAVSVATGFASIVLAWYHAGNTSQVWIQNQEMILGGLGGLGLVIVGVGLVVHDRLLAARAVDAERWERILVAIEASTTATPTIAAAPATNPRARRRPLSA